MHAAASITPLLCCCCFAENSCGPGRHRFVISDEALWFGSVVRFQVVRPAESNRLVHKFSFDVERTGRSVRRNGVSHDTSFIVEIRILCRFSDDRNPIPLPISLFSIIQDQARFLARP